MDLRKALLLVATGLLWAGCDLNLRGAPSDPQPAQVTVPHATATPEVDKRPVPASPLRDTKVFLEFGVYVPKAREDLVEIAERLRKGSLAKIPVVDAPSIELPTPWLQVTEVPITEYAPPAADKMRSFSKGVPASEYAAVAGAKQVVVVRAGLDGAAVDAAHRRLLEFVGALADEVGGYPWDEQTRQVLSRATWNEQRLAWKDGPPDVSRHVTMHAYRDGELIRIITLGMSKFGYPDVVANQVAEAETRSMGNLINLTCQTLVERGRLDARSALEVSLDRIDNAAAKKGQNTNIYENASRKTRLSLMYTPTEKGDPDNRLIELQFPARPGESLQQAQVQVLDQVYGSHDEAMAVHHDHPQLQAASAQARKELEALRSRFVPSRETAEFLQVKAPFATPAGGNEWMWVEVTNWQGETIKGVLNNDPFEIPGLKAGAHVEVKLASVFDYIHRRPDGTEAGNVTGPVIKRLAVSHREK